MELEEVVASVKKKTILRVQIQVKYMKGCTHFVSNRFFVVSPIELPPGLDVQGTTAPPFLIRARSARQKFACSDEHYEQFTYAVNY